MTDETELKDELHKLRLEVERLNAHRFIRVQNSVPKLLLFQFGRGVAFGLGTLIGASLLLSALGWSLSQIDFVPVIGDWASQVAAEIQSTLDGGN